MDKQICKNCGQILEKRETKVTSAQRKKPYYYSAYYFCPDCKKLYHSDTFKVVNHKTAPLFDGLSVKTQDEGQESYDVKIWTDGACLSNGTPHAKAAWAFVSDETERAGKVEGKQTNNVAEGLAIYYALAWAAEKGHKKILLHTDSQISLFNLQKPASRVKMNREIFERIEATIVINGLKVDYKKVLGHSGDPNNERADALANGMAAS